MPHDGFDFVAGTTVVQTVLCTRETERKSASPKRCGAAPSRADVVLHEESVLHHVGIRPNGLVRILWKDSLRVLSHGLGVGLDAIVNPVTVFARLPGRTMTSGAPQLIE